MSHGRRRRTGLAGMLVLVVVSWSGGCGRALPQKTDGGDGSTTTPDGLVGGRRSFDVVAALRADGGVNLPPTNRFTFVLDADARRVIAGGNGRGAVVGVTTSDGRTFRSANAFIVGGDGGVCSGSEYVQYDSVEVTIAGDTLTGSARGAASISCGDCSFLVRFSATLGGTIDATPPTLRNAGATAANPFDSFSLASSEPLPGGATARLVATDGATLDLVPTIVDGDIPLVVGFSKPDVVLRAGQGYDVALDGLVDFAGQTDQSGVPLRLTTFAAAPAVPEDGFESATGSVLGGAMVMTAGPLPAIAGNTSLYVGSRGVPALDSTDGRSLMVRLARQPGDTRLRFSYRTFAVQAPSSFWGTLRIGSEGASAGPIDTPFNNVAGPVEMLALGGQTIYASPVAVADRPLPADATGEVVVAIDPGSFVCGPIGPTVAGLMIDDLRLE